MLKKFIKKFWPCLFIVLIWFVFSHPYFIKDKVPYPSTYQVNHFHPWSANEKFWGPVKNGAMPDIIDQIYPWRHFSIEMLKKGEIAFWNPYSFSGNPHLANYQSAVLSPFNIIFLLLPFVDAWSILVLAQPLLASLFTYLLLREFKISKKGSVIGGISFMFSGFMVVWMAYGTLSMAVAFLPLALFAIKRSFNGPSLFSSILLTLSIPASFFSGHFQTSLYFLMFVFAFLIFESVKSRSRKKILNAWLAFFSGILISLIQIIPSIQLYLNSPRSVNFIKGGGIPFYYLITIFSPDFFGNPVTRNDWFGPYAEWASFIGIIPFTLAFFSFFNKKKDFLFFFFMGILSLILAIDSPIQSFLGLLKIPVLSTSDPNRIIVLFSFSFSILAAFGFEALKDLILKKEVKKIIIPLAVITIILFAAWFTLIILKSLPQDKIIIARRNFLLPTFFFFGMVFFTFLSLRVKKAAGIILTYLLISVSFDSFRFAQKWMPFDPKSLVFPNMPVVEAIEKNLGNGRIFGNVKAQLNTYYGFLGIEGYDPLYIGRYGEFIRASDTDGKYLEAERSVVNLGRDPKKIDRVLDILGVEVFFHPIADTNQAWSYPVWDLKDNHKLIYQDSHYSLFKRLNSVKRPSLFFDFEVIKKDKEILKRFYSKDFDYRKKVILEENPGFKPLLKGTGNAKLIEYSPNKIKIEVNSSSPSLLFLSDNYYPRWKAKVNGRVSKIYRTNYTFRSVALPKGDSIVEFIYGFF